LFARPSAPVNMARPAQSGSTAGAGPRARKFEVGARGRIGAGREPDAAPGVEAQVTDPGQLSLFDAPPADLPEGFGYRPDFVTPAEQDAILARLRPLPFAAFQFHGFEGKRRVTSFGWRYDFNEGGLKRAEPFPDWLAALAARAEAFAALPEGAFRQALVTEYAAGAGIGWHRDRPQFEDVAGLSFGAPCRFRFRLRQGSGWRRAAFTAEPRSAYLLRGPARREWEHSIPPLETLRYSITFRSFRGAPPGR
jgi:alkylated DNA repair dioxygenase AlkB